MNALFLLLLSQDLREVLASDRPIEVRVPISTEAQHRATVVTFPEESLEAMVAGWNEGDLSIERRRENLFIKLLRKAQGDIHVMGSSGTLYRLSIVAADGTYDGQVRIRVPKEDKHPVPDSVELLRAMRLGRKPADGVVFKADHVLFSCPEVTSRLAYIYETAAYRGFVVQVENVSASPQRLDPSRFVAKELLLVGTREMVIPPGQKTLMYIVFWKGA